MVTSIRCSVLIKFLVSEEPEELGDAAQRLVLRALRNERLVAPAWAWAEVGSILRKKVRMGLLQAEQAKALWTNFMRLPIDFVESPALRTRTWELAEEFELATLYDAAFLACTLVAPADELAVREFWTADKALLLQLGAKKPAYTRHLGALSHG